MKIKTGLLTVLIVLLTACTGVPMVNLEAKKVIEAAAEIADFNLPDAFQGLGGPALLVISMPVNRWNQDKVDTLLNSFH